MRMMNNQLKLIANESPYATFDQSFSTLGNNLETLEGKRVFFRTDYSRESIPLQSLSSRQVTSHSSFCLRGFGENPKERTIASIDSSCVLVGETDEGSIYAGRVATVFARGGTIQGYWRAGPVIVYLNTSTAKSTLGGNINKKILDLILFDRAVAERFVRIHLERRAQIQAAYSLSNAVIIVDGALRQSVLEQRESTLERLQEACEENFNELIGVSKSSSLRLITNAVANLQANPNSQVFVDLTESIKKHLPNYVSNRIVLAKFSPNSSVFRVDFSFSNREGESQILSDLKHNDSFFRGYPETLRLAHHLCVLDFSTISSVRTYLARKYEMIQVPSDDLRATILGKLV
jgi:NurA domain